MLRPSPIGFDACEKRKYSTHGKNLDIPLEDFRQRISWSLEKKLRRIYHGLNVTGFYWLLYSIALRTLLPLPLDLTV